MHTSHAATAPSGGVWIPLAHGREVGQAHDTYCPEYVANLGRDRMLRRSHYASILARRSFEFGRGDPNRALPAAKSWRGLQ